MQFRPNEDQAVFLSALEQMAQDPAAGWKTTPDWARFEWSEPFDRLLDDNGFFEAAAEDTLGPVAAAAMVQRLACLPVVVECAASALLRPGIAADLPRPFAVVEDDGRGAVRFLPVARSVVRLGAEGIAVAVLQPEDVEPVESLFAYPMGRLRSASWQPVEGDTETVRDLWRVAVAAEMAGAMKGALDAVVAHVRDRHQFGRPIGSFQAVQHRLAGASQRIDAAHWLSLKAAQSGDPTDAASALGYAQEISTKIVYDLHQFMGAMGLTLEHPLHRWTYRLRLLRSSLGGASVNLAAAAESRWRTA